MVPVAPPSTACSGCLSRRYRVLVRCGVAQTRTTTLTGLTLALAPTGTPDCSGRTLDGATGARCADGRPYEATHYPHLGPYPDLYNT